MPERLGPRSPFVGSSHVARLPWPPGVVRGTLTTSQAAAELSKFPVSAPDDVKPIDARFRHGVDPRDRRRPVPGVRPELERQFSCENAEVERTILIVATYERRVLAVLEYLRAT